VVMKGVTQITLSARSQSQSPSHVRFVVFEDDVVHTEVSNLPVRCEV
jgi:hypothetical protein